MTNKIEYKHLIRKYTEFFVYDEFPWTISEIVDEMVAYIDDPDFTDFSEKEFRKFAHRVAAHYVDVVYKGKEL
ncbi:MAG: hypothetical protein IKA00_11215 [Prevotella sp.]|nr:hypothetical protein [Prevotella sp.]